MGKVITLGEVKEIKPIPTCPLTFYMGMPDSSCRHTGMSLSPAFSQQALAVANVVGKVHKTLRHPAKEYIIVDTMTLVATIPLYNNLILRCKLGTLEETLRIAEQKAIDNDVSCYTMTIYYNHIYPDLFIHTEDLHADDTWG